MTDENKPQRRNLTGGLGAIRNPLPETQSAPTMTKNAVVAPVGFDTVPMPVGEVERLRENQVQDGPRRAHRQGRNRNFSVKLRLDTLEYIYEIANGKSVPLAAVIEELVDTHKRVNG